MTSGSLPGGGKKPMRPLEARLAMLRAARSPGCGCGHAHAGGTSHETRETAVPAQSADVAASQSTGAL